MGILTKGPVILALILFFITTAATVSGQSPISEEKKKKMYGFDPDGAFSAARDAGKSKRRSRPSRTDKSILKSDAPPVGGEQSITRPEPIPQPATRAASTPTTTEAASKSPMEAAPKLPEADVRGANSITNRRLPGSILPVIFGLIAVVLIAIIILSVKFMREYERVKTELSDVMTTTGSVKFNNKWQSEGLPKD